MKKPNVTSIETVEITDSSSDLEAQIRERAYELYEERGRQDGLDLEDWLQAESEISWQKARALAA